MEAQWKSGLCGWGYYVAIDALPPQLPGKAEMRATTAVNDHSHNEPAGGWRAQGLSTKPQRVRRAAPRDTDSGFNAAKHATMAHKLLPTSNESR